MPVRIARARARGRSGPVPAACGRDRARARADPRGDAARGRPAERQRRRGRCRARSGSGRRAGRLRRPTFRACSSTARWSTASTCQPPPGCFETASSRAGSFRSCSPPSVRRDWECRWRSAPRRCWRELPERRGCARGRAPPPDLRARRPHDRQRGRAPRVGRPAVASTSTSGRESPSSASGMGIQRRSPRRATQLERLWHASNLYRTRAGGGARGPALRSVRRRPRVLLQLRRRGDRGGAQVRSQGDREDRRRRARGRASTAARSARSPSPGSPGSAGPSSLSFRACGSCRRTTSRRSSQRSTTRSASCSSSRSSERAAFAPLDREFVAAAAGAPPLLCLDEIQTGVGRTGTFFAFEQLGVRPDLVTLAKGLANGLPIGALLVADEVGAGFAPGDHGSTFGGNPVSCSAACAVVDAIDDGLLANVARALCRALQLAVPVARCLRGAGSRPAPRRGDRPVGVHGRRGMP